ncbi:hypothetical protein CR201_G0035594 [Pongo abelii]|uniref:Uncharacterized protein n=1 Tax=Pongo abelii TaxID=9601 RepID=A0A2J8TE59_PONAB|nr:hypothetical protein CR201_G0035594 [Pongo abelii]
MEMQKSPVFCIAHAGSCRLELFLFGHLGSSFRFFVLTDTALMAILVGVTDVHITRFFSVRWRNKNLPRKLIFREKKWKDIHKK